MCFFLQKKKSFQVFVHIFARVFFESRKNGARQFETPKIEIVRASAISIFGTSDPVKKNKSIFYSF